MRNVDAKWNHDGTVLAICGTTLDTVTPPSQRDSNQVCFYSPLGRIYRTLKVPGTDITSLSWEGKSLRIAMAVDSFIYFANIRPDYIWCYFEKTVVFLNTGSGSRDSPMSSDCHTQQCQAQLHCLEQRGGLHCSGRHGWTAQGPEVGSG